jgi:multiple sugar transport system permease protein
MNDGNSLLNLVRILFFYVIIVLVFFAGFTSLARAYSAVRGQRGLKKPLVILTGLVYVISAGIFIFKPSAAILPAVIAIVSSVILGLLFSKPFRLRLSEPEIALLFILPAVTGIVLFYYYQIAQTAIYSLHFLDHTTKWTNETYVGLRNYVDVFQSKNFLKAVGFTFYFSIMAVFFEFWIGLGMAMSTFWVHRRMRGFLRSIIVIPWAIPPIISAGIWKWLYNADVGIGEVLQQWGLIKEDILFLVEPKLAMHSLILADVWKMAPMIAILMIGGLAAIPEDIYAAAKVDGARAFYRFRRITLPMLAPTILVALLFRSMDALRTFDLVFGLTKGGPGTTTETLSSYAYKAYFTSARFGLGSAYGMVVFAIILVLSFFYISRIKKNLRFKE